MKNYERWREGETKRVGIVEQRKAESILDKHNESSYVTLTDERTGETNNYKEDVAAVFEGRKTHKRRSKVFVVGDLPWKD